MDKWITGILVLVVGYQLMGPMLQKGAKKEVVAEAKALLESGEAQLIDVRTPAEYRSGHIEGAVNIPVGEIGTSMAKINKDTVIVYCRSGARSSRAKSVLESKGLKVLDVGGMGNWNP